MNRGTVVTQQPQSALVLRTSLTAGLLVLRIGAGLSLFAIYGLDKVVRLAAVMRSGHPISDWGFVQFIASIGLPFPVFFALCAVLNESVGALLVACGLLSRLSATCVAVGMAIAFYVSLRLHEDALRAALYLLMFSVVLLVGPGKFSIDSLIRKSGPGDVFNKLHDEALLVLRIGIALLFVLLFALPSSQVEMVFAGYPGRPALLFVLITLALFTTLGVYTRAAAAGASAMWFWCMATGLMHGQELPALPARSALFAIAFAALALTGSGRFSLDRAIKLPMRS